MQQTLANSAQDKARADKQCIVLDVVELSLAPLGAGKRPTHAQLAVELVGASGASVQTGPQVALSQSGKAELEFDAPFVMPPGSQLRAAAQAARKKGTLKLRVAVNSVVKGKVGKELGAGAPAVITAAARVLLRVDAAAFCARAWQASTI